MFGASVLYIGTSKSCWSHFLCHFATLQLASWL